MQILPFDVPAVSPTRLISFEVIHFNSILQPFFFAVVRKTQNAHR